MCWALPGSIPHVVSDRNNKKKRKRQTLSAVVHQTPFCGLGVGITEAVRVGERATGSV